MFLNEGTPDKKVKRIIYSNFPLKVNFSQAYIGNISMMDDMREVRVGI